MGAHSRRAEVANFLEPLLSAQDAKRADAHTIRTLSLSGNELMERAGLRIADEVMNLLKDRQTHIVVLCGPGNNGGDGWVVARRLWQNGFRTAVLSMVDPSSLKGEARVAAYHFLSAAENELWLLKSLDPPAMVVKSIRQIQNVFDELKPLVIIDALFGTGLKKPAEGLIAEAIDTLNAYKTKHSNSTSVISIDMPSGLPSDGQLTEGVHVRADFTLAIQFHKISHVSGPHWRACGRVSCLDVGIVLDAEPSVQVLLAKSQPPLELLRTPQPEYYKGHYGHIAILCGAAGMQGASQLAAYAALRSGAGLATRLMPQGAEIHCTLPELMHHTLTSPLDSEAFARFTAFVVGPGVGPSELAHAQTILDYARAHNKACVVDAGALPLLAKNKPSGVFIATPHPGEAARLLKTSAKKVESDRILSARALLNFDEKSDITWILKGACPIVAHKKHGLIVVEGGVTTLSVGGSGDVLAGLCAALIAQTKNAFEASLLGTSTHLQAGRNLLSLQTRGFLASEIADEIPRILFRK